MTGNCFERHPAGASKEQDASLLAFFREAYGDRYLGDSHFSESYLQRAERIVVLEGLGHVCAAALLLKGRMTAVAAQPGENTTLPHPRRRTMSELLREVHRLERESWITIHDQALGMQEAARSAGMIMLDDPLDLSLKLDRFGASGVTIKADEGGGLLVARAGSAHGEVYRQHAWGWRCEDLATIPIHNSATVI